MGVDVNTDPKWREPWGKAPPEGDGEGLDPFGAGPAWICAQHGVSVLYPDGMPAIDGDWFTVDATGMIQNGTVQEILPVTLGSPVIGDAKGPAAVV